VIMNRITHRRSPVWGDRSHFHHKLLDMGWGKRRIAVFYWAITLILGLIALTLNAREKTFTIVLLMFLFGGLLLWVNSFIISLKLSGPANGSKI
jgi:UDP-GlcNAc:undecaprenyl-phosphate/decaprenyl-phosphate GlcNAc-1-phosphate transferase